jgi:hypothetical protein
MASHVEFVKTVPAPRLVGIEPNPGPRSGERLSELDRWRVVIHHKDDHWNNKRIAKKLKCQENVVAEILKKIYDTNTVHDRPRSGRKRKISDVEGKKLAKQAQEGKYIRQITAEFEKKTKKSVDESTIRRAIKRMGKIYLKYRRVDRLTEAHFKARRRYARVMKDFNYKSVLFTDEKIFPLTFVPQGKWCEPGEHPEAEVDKWPKKLKVWAGIGYYFKTKLYFFTGTMKGPDYQACLRARLVKDSLIFAPDCPKELKKNWFLLQDGATCHKTKDSMKLVAGLLVIGLLSIQR